MVASTSGHQRWRVLVAGKLSRRSETEMEARACGAIESGYAGTLYFAFRDKAGAARFAALSEQINPGATVVIVSC